MANITVSVPDELKKKMDTFTIINWSAVAREAIEKRVGFLEHIKAFTKDSEFREEDAVRLGRKVSETASRRLRELAKKR